MEKKTLSTALGFDSRFFDYRSTALFVCVFPLKSPLFSFPKLSPLFSFCCARVRKRHKNTQSEAVTSERQTFWCSEWFFIQWFSDSHILCFVSLIWYSEFRILVGFIKVIRTYSPFIQTKILTLPLENHYIIFWYVNPVCLSLKRYHTKL